MTDPRIGDTVHYTRRGPDGEPPRCVPAIVTGPGAADRQLSLAVIHPGAPALHHKDTVNYDTHGAHIDADGDTWPTEAGFTPGTWHHLH